MHEEPGSDQHQEVDTGQHGANPNARRRLPQNTNIISREVSIIANPRCTHPAARATPQAVIMCPKSAPVRCQTADVAFSKAKHLEVAEMARSNWVYRKLRDFRAGIEATISFLKRSFGLDRCTWKSLSSFKSYVWSSVVSFNLLVIARHQRKS